MTVASKMFFDRTIPPTSAKQSTITKMLALVLDSIGARRSIW